MSQPQRYQVSLTGRRLDNSPEHTVIAALMQQFRTDEVRARALLGGRRLVKRDLPGPTAEKLVGILRGMGLEAVAEAAAPAPGAPAEMPLPLGGLAGQRLPTPRVTPVYVISLALVTVLCVVMPLFYFGLTAATTYAWYWYLTHIHHYITSHSPKFLLLVYGAPGLTGLVLVLFLLKPLFARRPRQPRPIRVDAEREQEFVAGVQALCKAIGTSPPREIHLTWDVNAWVHFRSGWFSLLTGHKVLTIGLPLMAGMSARQFTGVLAHEFGHFSQAVGMRCSFIINSVNAWLEFRGYGEDIWDLRLREWSAAADHGLVSLIIFVAQLGIGCTRLLMKAMFQVSFRMSRHLSRQMEFDADRYEALVAGSDCFRVTARNLRGLAQAFGEVNQANIAAWGDGRLLRNIPEAVALQFASYDKRTLVALEQSMREETTRYWDSHPADLDRIENAERHNCPGVYLDERPAAGLLRGFNAACERVTSAFYSEQGVRYQSGQLRDASDILALKPADAAVSNQQVEWFFNGQFQPLPLIDPGLMSDPAVAGLGWQDVIDRLRARSPEIASDWRRTWEMDSSRFRFQLALMFGLAPSQVALTGGDDRPPEVLRQEYERICRQATPWAERTRAAQALYMRRLRCAGETLAAPERSRFAALLRLLQGLHAGQQTLREMLELQALMPELQRLGAMGLEVERQLQDARARHHAAGRVYLATLDALAQPVVEGGTVGAWLRTRHPRLQDSLDDASLFQRGANGLPGSVLHLHGLALEVLAGLAAGAEQANGIRPIKIVRVCRTD